MKRIVIATILGLMAMSSTAEACHCRKKCHEGRSPRRCGGLFHHRRSCQTCYQQEYYQQTCDQELTRPESRCELAIVCHPPTSYQTAAVYQTVALQTGMTYATPQAVAQPQAPSKSTPQR
jgi:hypothetical protein